MANRGMPNNQSSQPGQATQSPYFQNGLVPPMPVYPQQSYYYSQAMTSMPQIPSMPSMPQFPMNGYYGMAPPPLVQSKSQKKPNLPVFKPHSSKNAPVVEKKELVPREKKILSIINPITSEVITIPTEKPATKPAKNETEKNEDAKKEKVSELAKTEIAKKPEVQQRGSFKPPPRTKTEAEDKEGYAARKRFEDDFNDLVKMSDDEKTDVGQKSSSLPFSEESKRDAEKADESVKKADKATKYKTSFAVSGIKGTQQSPAVPSSLKDDKKLNDKPEEDWEIVGPKSKLKASIGQSKNHKISTAIRK